MIFPQEIYDSQNPGVAIINNFLRKELYDELVSLIETPEFQNKYVKKPHYYGTTEQDLASINFSQELLNLQIFQKINQEYQIIRNQVEPPFDLESQEISSSFYWKGG